MPDDHVLLRALSALGGRVAEKQSGKAGEVLCHCPNKAGHENGDENPSFGINTDGDAFKCLVCGLKGKSPVTMAMVVLGKEKGEAVDWLREKGVIEARRSSPAGREELHEFDWKAARKRLLESESAVAKWARRGVTDLGLKAAGVGLARHRGTECFVVPMFGDDGKVVGRKCRPVDIDVVGKAWKRHGDGRSAKSLTWTKDRLGLLAPIEGFNRRKGVFVMEGEADFLCALSLRPALNAVGVPGAESVGGAVERALKMLAGTAPEFVVCADADEASRAMALKIAKVVSPVPCRLWQPADGCKDFGEMVERGLDPLERMAEATTIGKSEIAKVPERAEVSGLAATMRVVGGKALYAGAEEPKFVCNFDLRVVETVQRLVVETSLGPQSEVVVEMIPLGAERGPIRIAMPREDWDSTGMLRKHLGNAWPHAMFCDNWKHIADSLRNYAMMRDACADRIVREQSGWVGDSLMMPGLTVSAAGEVIEGSEVDFGDPELTGLGHRWEKPGDAKQLTELVLHLSEVCIDDAVNGGLLGMHLVASLSSKLEPLGVVRPHAMVDGRSNSGKTVAARAHGLCWWPGSVLTGGGSEINLKTSHTARAAERKAAQARDALLLIDNFNPHSAERERSWMELMHAIADSASSSRMTRDRKLIGMARIQCTAIVTVEDIPADWAAQNRSCLLTINGELTDAERVKRIAHVQAVQDGQAVLRSLVPTLLVEGIKRFGGLKGLLERIRDAQREHHRDVSSLPGRMADSASSMMAGLEVTGEILAGVVGGELAERVRSRFRHLLVKLQSHFEQGAMNGMVRAEGRDDVRLFSLLNWGLLTNRIRLADFNDDVDGGPIVGQVEPYSGKVSLIRGSVLIEARQLARQSGGRPFVFSDHALVRDLAPLMEEGRSVSVHIRSTQMRGTHRCMVFDARMLPCVADSLGLTDEVQGKFLE